ncbi:MAG: RNA polymerase sigma factor [Alistipes sp.]|nr:RNA polymerase sigma factor [Alistipes sp.]
MNSSKIYTELITELRDTLYRLSLSILGDSAEAEDVMQDVCERAWRTRDTLAEQSYPRAYVCRMAHNLAIDRLRQLQRRPSVSIEHSAMFSNDGEAQSNNRDIAALTRSIISQLPEKQRLAIHLRDVEGYEFEEIGEVLGIDETSVRMNLSRARKSVRTQLIEAMNYGVKRD